MTVPDLFNARLCEDSDSLSFHFGAKFLVAWGRIWKAGEKVGYGFLGGDEGKVIWRLVSFLLLISLRLNTTCSVKPPGMYIK